MRMLQGLPTDYAGEFILSHRIDVDLVSGSANARSVPPRIWSVIMALVALPYWFSARHALRRVR
jgi:hypothetical protein